jgi:hypothetical protein
VGETVSVLALGVGSSLVCTGRAVRISSFCRVVVCRRGWCVAGVGSLGCTGCGGLSGLLVPGEKIPQEGHDGDLLPRCEFGLLDFLGCLGGLRSAGCEPVAPAGAASEAVGGRGARWLVCGCVLHLCPCWFRSAAPGVGPRPRAGLSVSIRRSRVCGDVGVSARAQGCPCSWANRDPCAASVGVGRPLPGSPCPWVCQGSVRGDRGVLFAGRADSVHG